MTNNISISAVTLSNLNSISFYGKPVSCWMWVEERLRQVDRAAVIELIKMNCGYIAISAREDGKFHEEIDYIIEDYSDRLILTTSHQEISREVALEFFSINCEGGKDSPRLILVLGVDSCKEIEILSKMLQYAGEAIND